MKAEHRKELETNTLAQGASSLVDRIKTGRIGNYWYLAVVVAIAVVAGVWWYASREGRKADAATWAAYVGVMRGPTNTEIDDFVKNNEKTKAAQLARLEQARMRLGPEGITRLRSDESLQRAKGIENVEHARDEFLKLADEFKNDPSLRASVLLNAAEAELALVGVPKTKDGSSTETRGAPKVAAQLYRDAAKTIGESTAAGEGLLKRAEELDKKAAEIAQVGENLYRPTGLSGFGGGAPIDQNTERPKAPDKLDPKTGDPKVEGPKPPEKALTPIPPPMPPTTTAPTGKTPAPAPTPSPTTPATKK